MQGVAHGVVLGVCVCNGTEAEGTPKCGFQGQEADARAIACDPGFTFAVRGVFNAWQAH